MGINLQRLHPNAIYCSLHVTNDLGFYVLLIKNELKLHFKKIVFPVMKSASQLKKNYKNSFTQKNVGQGRQETNKTQIFFKKKMSSSFCF